jgi:hypothetical protein
MYIKDQGSAVIFLLGARGRGKTTLIKNLLYEKSNIFPIGIAMSGTEDYNHYWSKVFPPTFVYNKLDRDKIKDLLDRQKIAIKYLKVPWAVLLLDDCMDDPKLFREPLFEGIHKNSRHMKLLFINSLQYSLNVQPSLRSNVDICFIMREPSLRNRKILWENYASVIPDFTLFNAIMDQITNDYTSLVIVNNLASTDYKDCVFWYRAKQVPENWKFGASEYWEFHKSRCDFRKIEE